MILRAVSYLGVGAVTCQLSYRVCHTWVRPTPVKLALPVEDLKIFQGQCDATRGQCCQPDHSASFVKQYFSDVDEAILVVGIAR
jgi:hypothetical protein